LGHLPAIYHHDFPLKIGRLSTENHKKQKVRKLKEKKIKRQNRCGRSQTNTSITFPKIKSSKKSSKDAFRKSQRRCYANLKVLVGILD
jgi:hypothetical protein